MAIATLEDYQQAAKQYYFYEKAQKGSTLSTNALDFSTIGGVTAALTAYPNDLTTGKVPTKSTAGVGAMLFNDFSGNGYITNVDFYANGQAAMQFTLFDWLFCVGPCANNTVTTLSGQPSFSSRLPDGNYAGLQLWAQLVTASGGTKFSSMTVTYTDQSGNAGHTTGAQAPESWNNVGYQWMQWPLASGDSGLQTIESVTVPSSGTSTMTVNFCILRPIMHFYMINPGNTAGITGPVTKWLDKTMGKQIFSDSCLGIMLNRSTVANSTTPYVEANIEIASN